MMKNFKSIVCGAMASSALLLTSCLGSGTSQYSGYFYGVIDTPLSTYYTPVAYYSDYDLPLYSPYFETKNAGDCVYFYGTINYSDANNASSSKTYYTVDVSSETLASVDKVTAYYSSNSSLEAIKDVLDNELYVTGLAVANLTKGYLFLNVGHTTISSKEKAAHFKMEYDLTPDNTSGSNVYTLTLRAYTTDITGATTGSDINSSFNAYYIGDFLSQASSKEKAAGNSTVEFNIRYVSGVSDDVISVNTMSSNVSYSIVSSD